MDQSLVISGFWGGSGRPEPVSANVTVSGAAGNETLTVICAGLRATLPFRPLEKLAADARKEPPHPAGVELHSVTSAYFSRGNAQLVSAAIDIWFRRKDSFEMLSLTFGSGQLSLPYAPIVSLVQRQRRSSV